MTWLAEDTHRWPAPEAPWSPARDADDDVDQPELPPPPPYGYRYLEGLGYHPYVAAPANLTRSSVARARHLRSGHRSSLVAAAVAVVVVGVVGGALGAAGLGVTASPSHSAVSTTGASGSGAATQQQPGTARRQQAPDPSSQAAPGMPGPTSDQPTSGPPAPGPAPTPVRIAPGVVTAPSTGPTPTHGPPASSSGTPSVAPAAPSAPSTMLPAPASSPLPALPLSPDAQWYAANGSAIAVLQSDESTLAGVVPTVLSTGNISEVVTGCEQFGSEVSTLKARLLPDASLNPTWQNGLADYQSASVECITGATQQDAGLISQASTDLASGAAQIHSIVATLSTTT